jgi:glycosyltransferase involved in cell wall biosynthesis
MKIGIITTWYPAGGGYVSKAYREILSKDHKVFIYARGGKNMKGDPVWDDAYVTWAPYHYNGIKTKHLIHWATRNRIDILFFNEQRYWKPVIEAKKAGFCIGAYVDYYKQSTVRAFDIYDFLICNTKRHFSVFSWHENAFYVPWGTKVSDRIYSKSEDQPIRFLVSAGWQGSYTGDRRGTLYALDAFRRVTGNCEMLLYSQVTFDNLLPIWREKISADKRIKFIEGTVEPFPYEQGDVFIYPSKLDGIGLTLPEALAHGLPSITTSNPPMNEFVIEGINGLLIDVKNYLGREDGYYWAESHIDTDHLSRQMQNIVNNGHPYLNELKISTLDYSRKHLNWEENAKGMINIFEHSLQYNRKISDNLLRYVSNLDKIISPTHSQRINIVLKSFWSYRIKNSNLIWYLSKFNSMND